MVLGKGPCFLLGQSDRQTQFLSGLANARSLLKSLEHSIQRTGKYEQQLLRCRAKHAHAHSVGEWCASEGQEKAKAAGTVYSRSPADLSQTWSSVSIVCLQYQYEELSKRYEALLKAYDDRCSAVNSRDIALENLQRCLDATRAELKQAHQSLLAVGEKFLELKDKKKSETAFYEEIIISLREAVSRVVDYTERARAHLDRQLEKCMKAEKDTTKALLLAEIRKCNILYVENLRLKTCIENFEPGFIDWERESF
ncbi:uncharacterized protein LOC128673262 [Plodia interpunctella]|uniref:uncharacterized protein LOC128673262 n=1 Tax=Plodia interpunctella TaxID=58824 RepID=UPI003100F49B